MFETIIVAASLIVVAIIACIIVHNIAKKKFLAKGYEARKAEAEAAFGSAEAEGKRLIADAVKEGENKKREFLLAAKEEIHKSRIDFD